MRRNPFIDDYKVTKEVDYIPLIKELVDAVNRNDDAAIKDLALAVRAVADRQPAIIKQDNTEVLHALGGMVDQLKTMCQSADQNNIAIHNAIKDMDAPNVNVAPVIEAQKKPASSYKFEIKRNTANLITEVVATPIRELR